MSSVPMLLGLFVGLDTYQRVQAQVDRLPSYADCVMEQKIWKCYQMHGQWNDYQNYLMCQRAWNFWYGATKARDPKIHSVNGQLNALTEMQTLIGDEAYFAGEWP